MTTDRSRFDYIVAEDHFKIVDSLVNEIKELVVKRNELMELCVEIREARTTTMSGTYTGKNDKHLYIINDELDNKLCELTKGK